MLDGFDFSDELEERIASIAEEHERFGVEIELVVDTGEAWRHAPLENDDIGCLIDVEDRHAIERTGAIRPCGWIGDVIRSDDEGDIGVGEIRIDPIHLEELGVGDVGFG